MRSSEKPLYPFPRYREDHPSFSVIREWWRDLEDDRGERAALRRAASLTEVMLSAGFHGLLRRLRGAGCAVPESRYANLAAIAGLAARVKDEAGDVLGTVLGSPATPAGQKPVVSGLRMRRILACETVEELYTLLRRALALAGCSLRRSWWRCDPSRDSADLRCSCTWAPAPIEETLR